VWKLKLARANTFLTKVRQRAMPGSEEIAVLVKNLDAEYTTASWNMRTMFAHVPKPSITRVKHSWYEKATSKLPRELRPEDIIEKKTKEWTEMDDADYDGNYEASTDSVHPVSADYSHLLDDDDGAWTLQHISEEDIAGTQDSVGFDFSNGHGWSWGEDNNVSDTLETTGQWQESPTEQNEKDRSTRSNQDTEENLVAEAPSADSTYSTDDIYITARQGKEAEHKAEIKEVIQAFWSVVNHNEKYTEPQTPPTTPAPNTNALASILACLHVDECKPFSTLEPITPPRERTLWTDGPSGSPPTLPTTVPPKSPLPPPRPLTPPSPNSTRAWYDKQRKILKRRRETDITKYYSDWLYISRCEIQDFEGPDGNMIREPLKVRG
jgi:hypothetical protein